MSIFSNHMTFTVIVISTAEPVEDDSADEDHTDSKPNVRSHTKATCSSLFYTGLASLGCFVVLVAVLVAVLVMFGK